MCCEPQDGLGTGFVMARVEGETIARKILRDAQFAEARPRLARQLGEVLAGIHGIDRAQLPELRRMTAAREIAEFERDYRGFDWPRPVFELALRWLRDHDPGPSQEVTLVHGDFRHGNLIIGPDGVARGARLGTRPYRRSHGGSRLGLRQFLAFRRDRQAGRRFWLARRTVRRLRGGRPPGRSRSGEILGSDGHAALGRDVLRHDAALSQRPRSFDRARHDRPALVGDRDRSVAAIGCDGVPKWRPVFGSDQSKGENKCRTNRHRPN